MAEVTLGPVTLGSIHLDAVEVGWPHAAAGPSRARLRTPFDADVHIAAVRFHVAPSSLPGAFFRVAEDAAGLEVELVDGRASLRIGHVRVDGVDVPCEGLRLGGAIDRVGFAGGHIGSRRLTVALRVHAEPSELAPSFRRGEIGSASSSYATARGSRSPAADVRPRGRSSGGRT